MLFLMSVSFLQTPSVTMLGLYPLQLQTKGTPRTQNCRAGSGLGDQMIQSLGVNGNPMYPKASDLSKLGKFWEQISGLLDVLVLSLDIPQVPHLHLLW